MEDIDIYLQSAYAFHALRKSLFLSALQALQLPSGSHGLDAGCGIGLQAMLLAEHVGPAGHVTGLDLSPDLLVVAQDTINEARLANRVSLRQGDVRDLPFDDDAFDWAWSVDCVGYAPLDPLPLVNELARVVKPGGTIAILAWTSERLLPGFPLLEARLNSTAAGIAPFSKDKSPESHILRALGWYREAGLEGITAHTFAGDFYAPLDDDQRSALVSLFEMRWPGVQSELTSAEWLEFQRLCRPDSADFIVDHPDYYAFFTYSMFQGKVVSAET